MRVLRWQELVEAGRADPRPGVSAAGTDLCTIMYTSGTTGKPKARAPEDLKSQVLKPTALIMRGCERQGVTGGSDAGARQPAGCDGWAAAHTLNPKP